MPSEKNAASHTTKTLTFDKDIMRRAKHVKLGQNTPADASLVRKIGDLCNLAKVKMEFDETTMTACMSSDDADAVRRTSMEILEKYDRFKHYIDQRSITWQFDQKDINIAKEEEIDLVGEVHANCQDVKCIYNSGSLAVDLFVPDPKDSILLEKAVDRLCAIQDRLDSAAAPLPTMIPAESIESLTEIAGINAEVAEKLLKVTEGRIGQAVDLLMKDDDTALQADVAMINKKNIENFMEVTGADADVAKRFLQMTDCQLKNAVSLYMKSDNLEIDAVKAATNCDTKVQQHTPFEGLNFANAQFADVPRAADPPEHGHETDAESNASFVTAEQEPYFALVRFEVAIKEAVIGNVKVKQALVAHLTKIAEAYDMHVLFSPQHGGVQMKCFDKSDLCDAQSDLRDYFLSDSFQRSLQHKSDDDLSRSRSIVGDGPRDDTLYQSQGNAPNGQAHRHYVPAVSLLSGPHFQSTAIQDKGKIVDRGSAQRAQTVEERLRAEEEAILEGSRRIA